jgi:hypothetical protein
MRVTRSASMANAVRHLRRLAGIPKSSTQAKAAPPHMYQRTPPGVRYTRAQPPAAVVEIVRVAVPAAVPVMLTGLVEPKLRMGRFCAPLGLEVTAAVSATLPVKPPDGVTVMVDVFPVAAPAVTVSAVPVIVKPRFSSVTVSLATKAFPDRDLTVAWNAPPVTGKSYDTADPATYTLPESSRANALAWSPSP